MNRIALVVQRCHESVVGGSEALAWQYANLLKDAYEVDVLSTTAVDIFDWANELPAGDEMRDGVRVRLFPVTVGRTSFWSKLNDRMHVDFRRNAAGKRQLTDDMRYLPWSISLQEEFIRTQGPHSEPLLIYLRERWSDYEAIIFVTYLYPTSYFGMWEVPPRRALFVPTLHDELPAYLSVYKHAAHRAREVIWLTDAERRFGQTLWGELPGRVVSMRVETELHEPAKLSTPYILYSGRIDPNKGCRELFEYFIEFKKQHPSDLRLILTGKDDMAVAEHPDIEFRGFVSDDEKYSLMAGAEAFVMPSAHESFSIVTLEAMAQRAPVLANGLSEVLSDHVRESGGGKTYKSYRSFAAALRELLADNSLRAAMGARGREYTVARYTTERVRAALMSAVVAMNRES
jgi:glycosyltransferase involved in cell wall biosynthesis